MDRRLTIAALLLALLIIQGRPAIAGSSQVDAVCFTVGDGTIRFTNTFKTTLLSFIQSATASIDVAGYNIRDDDFITALKTAYQSGKSVRIVTDYANNQSGDPIKALSSSIIKDDRASDPTGDMEMHHKFIIVDNSRVWTGSANFTTPSFSAQNNNAVIITDAEVANAYKTEFDRLYVDGQFHQNTTQSMFSKTLDDGTVVEVRFAPGMHIQDAYAKLCTNATNSIYFAIYTFGSSTISDAMKPQVYLRNYGLFDLSQYTFGFTSQYTVLNAAGWLVALDDNPVEMHHKYLVIDGMHVATGSFNFTVSADEDNDENSIVLKNNTSIAEKYIGEINRLQGLNLDGVGENDPEDTSPGTGGSGGGGGDTSTATTTTTNGHVLSGPNPFVPGLNNMVFTSSGAGAMQQIEIYDLSGRVIRRLTPNGAFTATWDGRNSNNTYIASGVYYYRVECAGKYHTGRFTVVR